MLDRNLPLLLILTLGLLFRNELITTSAGIVLVLKAANLPAVLGFLERRSLQMGLILLTLSVLTPLSRDRLTAGDLLRAVSSWIGLAAVVGGAIASTISRPGVELLQSKPDVIIGLMVGTILGVVFWRGIPVGPLAASGLAAVLLMLLRIAYRR